MKKTYAALALTAVAFAASSAFAQSQPVIGLITKTESNPFFVKMKELSLIHI
jgi:fructose transport system substrate-binding protein